MFAIRTIYQKEKKKGFGSKCCELIGGVVANQIMKHINTLIEVL